MDWEKNRPLYLIMAVLLAMVIYQQFLITDLQERMMNIESSRYDDQLNDIRWEAETALSQTKNRIRTSSSSRNTPPARTGGSWKWNGTLTGNREKGCEEIGIYFFTAFFYSLMHFSK